MFYKIKKYCILILKIRFWEKNSVNFLYKNKKISIMNSENKTESKFKKQLPPERYKILREKATEPAFSGSLLYNKEKGIYMCAACSNQLFSSDAKFESDTGWPSFNSAISKDNVKLKKDTSHNMIRTEVICAKCGSHLGHVFDDGPPSDDKRYCINSLALEFDKKNNELATFGAGCFWHVQDKFNKLDGVEKTKVGYMGGTLKNPTYKDVCTDKTGHAEVIQIEYNPNIITYDQLLDFFWSIHNPTTLNRQGPDIGTQYRSVIYYHTKEQKEKAYKSKQRLEDLNKYSKKVVTEISSASEFYKAEDYHQNYFKKNKIKT